MVPSKSSAGSPALLAVKRDIESMKTRGAGEIGKQAAAALATAAQTYEGDDVAGFQAFLVEAAQLLAAARPTAVTLRNGLNAVLQATEGAKTVKAARERVATAAKEHGEHVDAAKKEIAKLALPLFKANDVLLTHCHSSVAGGVIAHAAKNLKGIRAFSTETRPFRQGLIQSPWLAKEGVDVTLVVDSAVSLIMETEKVTRVVVGADTIDAQGGLYNKIGTRQVALLAKHFGIPVIVCAERDKFSPYTLEGETVRIEERAATEIADPAQVPGVKIRNPVFDRTPPELISVYVTDRGLVEPKDVRAFVQREFGTKKRWI